MSGGLLGAIAQGFRRRFPAGRSAPGSALMHLYVRAIGAHQLTPEPPPHPQPCLVSRRRLVRIDPNMGRG